MKVPDIDITLDLANGEVAGLRDRLQSLRDADSPALTAETMAWASVCIRLDCVGGLKECLFLQVDPAHVVDLWLETSVGFHADRIVALLLERGAEVHRTSSNGESVLWGALKGLGWMARPWNRRMARTVEALLLAGADFNAPDRNGVSPLKWAQVNHHPDLARMIVAAIAEREAYATRQTLRENVWTSSRPTSAAMRL